MKTKWPLLFAAGVLFGAGLALSGMTNPGRVIGFLDITGHWDPSLAFVMGGALTTFAVGTAVWRKGRGAKGLFDDVLPTRDTVGTIDRRIVIGSLIFGIGWGISGFCPGPAIANLAALRPGALAFVPAMAVGALLARVWFGADQD
jgi:uncharacterized membrane protein YedE/YeeE